MNKETLNITIPEDLAKLLDDAVVISGKRKSWLVKKAIREYLEDMVDGYVAQKRAEDGKKPVSSDKVFRDLGI